MDADLTYAAFQLDGVFQHFLHQFGAPFVLLLKLRDILYAVLQRRLDFLVFPIDLDRKRTVRNHLCKPVGLVDGKVADAGNIF